MATRCNINGINELDFTFPGATTVTVNQGIASIVSAEPSGAANEVLATPNGSSGVASLRTLVPADLPITNEPAVLHNFLTAYNSTTGAFSQAQPAFTDISGTATAAQIGITGSNVAFATSAAGNFSIAHTLGVSPSIVVIELTSAGSVWFQATRYDATNVYLTASGAGLTGYVVSYVL